LSYLAFKFYNATDTFTEKIYDLPPILQTKTYNFNLMGDLSGQITRIEIYPVTVTSSNEEVVGPIYDTWNLR
jgi:hypothetical protein